MYFMIIVSCTKNSKKLNYEKVKNKKNKKNIRCAAACVCVCVYFNLKNNSKNLCICRSNFYHIRR